MTTILKLRTALDRPLTNIEVDGNFTGLLSDIDALSLVTDDLYSVLASTEQELSTSIASTRQELVTSIATTEQELSTSIASTRQELVTSIATKAPLHDPIFTGTVEVPTYVWSAEGDYAASLDYITSRLENVNVNLLPSIAATSSLNPSTGNIDYSGIDIGSADKPFANIWVESGHFAANTISIGTADISSSEAGGIVLPFRTAIGVTSNIIPANIVSTELDIRYAQVAQVPLIIKLTADSAIIRLNPVGISSNGRVQSVGFELTDNTSFIGFCSEGAEFGETVSVVISGPLDGFSDLVPGSEYFIGVTGTLETALTDTNIKVGVATTDTVLFIYSNSSLDIYGITNNKLDYNDLSIGTNSTPFGEGGITYDSSIGEFKFIPPLVTTLDNLNLTGIPTAPTAVSGTNTTQLATTEFVNTEISNTASTDSPHFTGIPTAPTAVSGTSTTQLATTEFVMSNGGGLNIDGGFANTIRNTSTIALNGGGA